MCGIPPGPDHPKTITICKAKDIQMTSGRRNTKSGPVTSSAPGAAQLSSQSLIQTSPTDACQSVCDPTEPVSGPSTCKAQARGATRRTIINIAINSAAFIATPIAPANAASEAKDPAARLARMEQAIDVLRTSYVCQGWKLDEAAADRALDYFRKGCPDNDDHWTKRHPSLSSMGSRSTGLFSGILAR